MRNKHGKCVTITFDGERFRRYPDSPERALRVYWTSQRGRRLHRAIYEKFVGPIPDGLTIDHLCRNRLCVNPAHLEPVTLAANVLRGESLPAKNARKTHCPKGHPYDETNTHITKQGWRICKACNRERQRSPRG